MSAISSLCACVFTVHGGTLCLCMHVFWLWCWHANAMCKHSHGSYWPGCQDTHSKQSPNAYGLILNVAPPSPMIPNEHIFTAEAWCSQLLQLNAQTGLPSNIISRPVTSGTNHIICKKGSPAWSQRPWKNAWATPRASLSGTCREWRKSRGGWTAPLAKCCCKR